jgi:hypothetical protein
MDVAVLHRYGPWVLLIMGLWGLVYLTLLYGTFQRLMERLLASAPMEKLAKDNEALDLARGLAGQASRSRAMWWLSVAQVAALLIGAVVWFALRP